MQCGILLTAFVLYHCDSYSELIFHIAFLVKDKMGRPKSEDRLVYDSKFQKTQDGKWQCLLCQQVLPGMKASNFLSHAKDHIERSHPDAKEELENRNNSNRQLKISSSFTTVTNPEHQIELISLSFANTTLPMNFLRCAKSRKFIEAVLKHGRLPNYKTVMKTIGKLANSRLQHVETAEYYGIQLDHCLLNPSKQAREMLSDAEISSAKQYLLQYEKLTDVPIDVGELLNEPTTSTSDPIESIFENACPIPAKRIATTCHALTLETELETFLQTIDDQTCAFDFFKSHINQKSFPRLSEVARFVLGILPSPAVCEQNFSRAAILTENRRNKLSMLSVKNRLILS